MKIVRRAKRKWMARKGMALMAVIAIFIVAMGVSSIGFSVLLTKSMPIIRSARESAITKVINNAEYIKISIDTALLFGIEQAYYDLSTSGFIQDYSDTPSDGGVFYWMIYGNSYIPTEDSLKEAIHERAVLYFLSYVDKLGAGSVQVDYNYADSTFECDEDDNCKLSLPAYSPLTYSSASIEVVDVADAEVEINLAISDMIDIGGELIASEFDDTIDSIQKRIWECTGTRGDACSDYTSNCFNLNDCPICRDAGCTWDQQCWGDEICNTNFMDVCIDELGCNWGMCTGSVAPCSRYNDNEWQCGVFGCNYVDRCVRQDEVQAVIDELAEELQSRPEYENVEIEIEIDYFRAQPTECNFAVRALVTVTDMNQENIYCDPETGLFTEGYIPVRFYLVERNGYINYNPPQSEYSPSTGLCDVAILPDTVLVQAGYQSASEYEPGPGSGDTTYSFTALHTSGNQILDAENNPVLFRGVNMWGHANADDGLNKYCSDACNDDSNPKPHCCGLTPERDWTYAKMREYGFNAVRRTTSRERWISSSTLRANMDIAIGYAENNEIYFLLSVSKWWNQQFEQTGSNMMGMPPDVDDYIDLWRDIATRYAGRYPNLIYNIHNEPYPEWGLDDERDWQTLAQRTVEAIREVDMDHIIVIPISGVALNSEYFRDNPILDHPDGAGIVYDAGHFYWHRESKCLEMCTDEKVCSYDSVRTSINDQWRQYKYLLDFWQEYPSISGEIGGWGSADGCAESEARKGATYAVQLMEEYESNGWFAWVWDGDCAGYGEDMLEGDYQTLTEHGQFFADLSWPNIEAEDVTTPEPEEPAEPDIPTEPPDPYPSGDLTPNNLLDCIKAKGGHLHSYENCPYCIAQKNVFTQDPSGETGWDSFQNTNVLWRKDTGGFHSSCTSWPCWRWPAADNPPNYKTLSSCHELDELNDFYQCNLSPISGHGYRQCSEWKP